MVYRAVVLFCRTMIRLFSHTGVEVRGAEHVPETGGAVLVANHASHLDPPVIAMGLRRHVYFMAREGILTAPLVGPILRRCGAFPVRQGTADRAAIRHAMALLSRGELVCVFPEGTRTATGDLQVPQPGAALIAN